MTVCCSRLVNDLLLLPVHDAAKGQNTQPTTKPSAQLSLYPIIGEISAQIATRAH